MDVQTRIRIVSTGKVDGTRVYNADTGEDITGLLQVRAITWHHEAGDYPQAVLACNLTALETTLADRYWKAIPPTPTRFHRFKNWLKNRLRTA